VSAGRAGKSLGRCGRAVPTVGSASASIIRQRDFCRSVGPATPNPVIALLPALRTTSGHHSPGTCGAGSLPDQCPDVVAVKLPLFRSPVSLPGALA
jgi:hypothetical protein